MIKNYGYTAVSQLIINKSKIKKPGMPIFIVL